MGYQVLARKYRPQRFSDVAGQDHVTRTLLNALAQERIAHGYIFSGHRGIGKTTIARILAMALNCRTQVGSTERPTHEPCLQCVSCREIASGGSAEAGNEATHSFDFIEIDAASNRGIDEVRSIRNQASVQPARDRYKIFLLDEAHQITDAAFNAILKTLEEPPEWTIFMMATTEPENIPQTIRSRCQHFSFHAVKFDDILAQLRTIATHEQVAAEDDALALLAEAGDGSMRDALSIMDQAIASAPVQDGHPVLAADLIRDLMGSVPNAVFERLLEAVSSGQSAALLEQLNELLASGHSPSSLARQMVRYLRNALMAKLGGEQTELLQISSDERARAARTALLFTEEELTRNLQIMLRTFDDLNFRQEQRLHLELGMIKLIHAQRLLPMEELLSAVASGGAGVRLPQAPAAPKPTRTAPVSPQAARPVAGASEPATTAPLSPFGPAGGGWSSGPGSKMSTPATAVAAVPRPIAVATSAPASAPGPAPASAMAPTAPPVRETPPTPFAGGGLTEGALARVPQTEPVPEPTSVAKAMPQPLPAGSPSVEAIQQTVVDALEAGGQSSASQLLASGSWILEGTALRIEVPGIGKKMLGLVVNTAAEKIIRNELQRLGAPTRFMAVPGEGGAQPAKSSLPAGALNDAAMGHPLVQRAKDLFHAEVRSVVDLRIK